MSSREITLTWKNLPPSSFEASLKGMNLLLWSKFIPLRVATSF